MSQRVLAVLAPAGDDVVALVECATSIGMSRGSFCRSASEVTITRAARVREAGRHRRRLAEVAAEADDADARVARGRAVSRSRTCRRCCRRRPTAPRTSVPRVERRRHLRVQLLDVRRFVVDGNDDRELWAASGERGIIPHRPCCARRCRSSAQTEGPAATRMAARAERDRPEVLVQERHRGCRPYHRASNASPDIPEPAAQPDGRDELPQRAPAPRPPAGRTP